MKQAVFLIWMLIIPFAGITQITFKTYPLDLSIIPRDLSSQKGEIVFEGNTQYASIWVSRYKNNHLEFNVELSLDTASSIHTFKFIDSIESGLFNYRYEFTEPTKGILKIFDSICSGDIYIVNGQSNAESASKGESSISLQNSFIRTYGNASESPCPKKWMKGSGDGTKDIPGHIGQLGLALAYELMAEKHIPIAIFNGGVGGKEINYFLRDESNYSNSLTSYGRLLTRLKESNTASHVRAIVWYQGEKDAGIGTTFSTYFNKLKSLYSAWTNDFKGFENLYIYQVRQGCSQAIVYTGAIQEAHLEFANQYPNVQLISTNHVNQNMDECHYDFKYGYRVLAEYAAQLMLHFQYGDLNTYGISSLLLKQIKKRNDFEIEIDIDNPDPIYIDKNCVSDFYLNANNEHPIDMRIKGHSLILNFANVIPSNYHLSYVGHSGIMYPSITDPGGHGFACFYNLGDTTFDWHFDYVNSIPEAMPLIEHADIVIDTNSNTPPILPTDIIKEGYHFHPAMNELIVESSLAEVSTLTIEFYNTTGELVNHQQYQILYGKNRLKLPIEPKQLYLLNMQVRSKTYIAYKKLKMMY